ncbi:spore maturation protein [Clostridia bacterium]|nr:spore maturation protein [Clostridia bacterium]
MKIMLFVSDMIIPLTFIIIIGYGYLKKVNVYEVFIKGAEEGFKTVLGILPTLIGLMVAVGFLRVSGTLDLISNFLSPLCEVLGYPKEAVPLTFMRLVSSSAATGLLLDIFKNYGADSFLGRFVSIMMSSTETILYTMSVYFMCVKVTKTRYTLAGAFIANLAGILAALWITKLLF